MSTDEWKYGRVNNIAQTRHLDRVGHCLNRTCPDNAVNGRHRTGYLTIHQRSLLDPLYRCTIARAFLLWKLEQCCQALQALGQQVYGKWYLNVYDDSDWLMNEVSQARFIPVRPVLLVETGHGTYKVLNTRYI